MCFFVRVFFRKGMGKPFFQKRFSHNAPESRFFFDSILAAGADHNNGAFSFWHAQDGFALFALKIDVRFAVAPLVAAELKKVDNRLLKAQIAV